MAKKIAHARGACQNFNRVAQNDRGRGLLVAGEKASRAALDRTAEGGCPHVVRDGFGAR